ncbi:MAG: GLUG motif-containing protein, partial [archaeon]
MLRKKRSAAKSNSLSAQGTIKEPFGKRFAKKSIAQGTIEYLVVVAVVIVLALIVVVVIFGSSDKSSDTVVSAVRLSMKSGAIGFAELAGDVNGDMLVSLLNNTGEFIYIQMISLIGKNGTYSRSFSNAQVAPGASALFFLDSFPECKCTTPGETLICEFSIQYQSVSGLVKNFLLKAVVDCVADVDENHGNPFTPTCWSENTACLIGANCCGGVCTLGLCGPGGQDQGCASGYNDCDGNSSNGCETLGACPVCTVDANCVDARECTVDTCVGGQCVNDATSCLPLNLSSITDCNTLQNMQNNLDGNYVLANDIDCSLFNWIPVGDSNAPFAGILDGNNHTIQNLVAMYGNSQLAVVDENSRIDNYGIFGAINYAQINNLFVIQSEATGYFSVGMLAGDANNSTISNCHVQANQVFGSSYVGGLVGFAENTTISDSNFSGPIISGYFSNIYTSLQDPSSYLFNEGIPYSAGGIAGYFKNGTINDVNVTLQIIGVSHVGGLVGLLSDSNVSGAWVRTVSPQSILLPSYAVDGIFSVGGIAGLAKNSTIGSAHFIGTVRGIMRVGGIVGSQINGSMTAVNSDLNIIGTNNVDSVAGRILNTTLSTTYGTGVGYLQISDSYVTTLSLQKYLNAPSNIESVSNAVSDINYGNFSYSNPRVVLNCTDLEDMNSVLDGNYYLAQDVNCSQIVSFASVGSCINAATCGGYSSLDENTIFLGSLRGKSNITDLTGNLFGCSTSSEIEPNLTSGNKVACDYSSINPQTQAIGSWWGYYFGNTPWFVYKWYWSGYPLWWQWPGAGYAYWDWSYWNGFSSWYRSYGYGPNYYCGGSYNYSYGDSGTITNPIKIYDCPGLQNITNNLDANYRIMRDINCADYNFVPIGTVGYCNEDGNSMGMDEAPCAYIGETSCEAIRYCMCDQDHDGCNADDPNWMNGNNYSEPECLYCNNQGNNTCDPHSYSSGCQSTWNIEAPFKGSINGGGFVISNLTINRGYVNKQNYVGMIGYGKNATFKNLKFVGASLTSSPSNLPGGDGGLWSMPHLAAGVVAGSCDSCAFTNINVDGSVVLSFGSNSFGAAAGLITGYGYWSNYYNLFSSGSVTLSETAGASSYTPESGAGGLIGASRNESITRAGSTADVLYTLTGPVSLNGYVGGLVGTAYSSNLYRGYHVGDVTGSGSLCNLVDDMASGCMFAGGIMGGRYDTSDYPPGGLVSTSYNIGNVTGDLAGALAGSASVTYSYADGNVIGIFGAATTSGALYGYGAQYVYTRVTVTAPRKAGVSAIRCQPACSASNYIYWDSGLFSNPDLCLAGCGGQDYNGEGYMLTSSQLRDVNVMPSAFSSGEFCMCSGDYPRLAWETGVDPTCDCAKPITNCT